MALGRTTLNVLLILYLVLVLAVWLGWQVETDRRMRREGRDPARVAGNRDVGIAGL
jgi:hypothetical protein